MRGLVQRIEYRQKCSVERLERVDVPETQYTVADGSQPGVPLPVVFGSFMLTAVNFDNQLAILADEICNVLTNGNLPAKLEILEAAVTQGVPEFLFSIGHVLAELSGKFQLTATSPLIRHRATRAATFSLKGRRGRKQFLLPLREKVARSA